MNKKEIIEIVAEQADLSKSKTEMALNVFLHTVQDTLARGDSVQMIGFGTFGVSSRAARKGRNPQTGAEIDIPAAKTPHFKAGKTLKNAVNT